MKKYFSACGFWCAAVNIIAGLVFFGLGGSVNPKRQTRSADFTGYVGVHSVAG